MPKITIDDFTGGRNSIDAINQLRNNQSPDQLNTYVENLALIQRRGCGSLTPTASGLTPSRIVQLKETRMASGSLFRMMMFGYMAAARANPFFTDDGGATYGVAAYTVGTCGTTGTTTTIDFAGGPLLTQHAAIGDYFIKSGGTPNRITAVNADNQIVVTATETIGAGTAYKIVHTMDPTYPMGLALFDISGAQNLIVADRTRAFRYDGTNVRVINGAGTEGYSMPLFGGLIVHKNYVFGILHNNTDIRWCALKDLTSWPSNNFQTVTTVADPLRGAIVFGNYIVIFTRSRMFRLLGDVFDPTNPTYALQQIAVPPNFTFYWPRTAILHMGVLKFLASDGWYYYDGGAKIEKFSQPIQTDVDGFNQVLYSAETMALSAVAYVWKNDMYCAIPDSSVGDSVINSIYVHDKRGKWWRWKVQAVNGNRAINDFLAGQFTGGVNTLYIGTNTHASGDTNTVLLPDSVLADGSILDGGNTIGGYWQSKELVFPADVEFSHALVTMKKQAGGNVDISFSVDRRTFVAKTLAMNAGAGTVIRKMVNISRVGKAIRLKIGNATSGYTFELYSIELFFNPGQGFRK